MAHAICEGEGCTVRGKMGNGIRYYKDIDMLLCRWCANKRAEEDAGKQDSRDTDSAKLEEGGA